MHHGCLLRRWCWRLLSALLLPGARVGRKAKDVLADERNPAVSACEGPRQIWKDHAPSELGPLMRSDGFSSDTTVYGGTPCVSHTLEPITE
jgi:hypothetical protein